MDKFIIYCHNLNDLSSVALSASALTRFLRRYMVKPQDDNLLVSLSLKQFVKSVSARTAAPGGGSVSAAVAALVKKTKTKKKKGKPPL